MNQPLIIGGAVLLLGIGCNNTAVLEGTIALPQKPDQFDNLYVSVQVTRDFDFDDTWSGGDLETQSLKAGSKTNYRFSVTTENPTGNLRIKLRFCLDRHCGTLGGDGGISADPQAEIWYELEQPFYLQERNPESTEWGTELTALPFGGATPSAGCAPATHPMGVPTWLCRIDKCQIKGCVQSDGTSDFCDTDLETGIKYHFCEGIPQ